MGAMDTCFIRENARESGVHSSSHC